MGTVRKSGGLTAFGLFVLVMAGFGLAQWWGDRHEKRVAQATLAADAPQAETTASARKRFAGRQGLIIDEQGCLLPANFANLAGQPEHPGNKEWRSSSAGDRLRVDACGHLWALWFSSWLVLRAGEPEHVAHVELARDGPIADLARAGVASFLLRGGELWLLGRNDETGRYRQQRWQRLPARPGCGEGQLAEVEGAIWLACGDAAPIASWNEEAGDWIARPELKGLAFERLARSPQGDWHAVGAGRLWQRSVGPEKSHWRDLGPAPRNVQSFATNGRRHYFSSGRHGNGDGLMHLEKGRLQAVPELAGQRITGIAVNGRGGFWVSVGNAGLAHHDGQRWWRWRYAQGLPDDEGRDVLVDARGRLWLAGDATSVIDERIAAERIRHLQTPAALPGKTYADACAAASALLGRHGESGEVASDERDGRQRVFFAGRQVCPWPLVGDLGKPLFHRRNHDGALLELPVNGHRGWTHCGTPCDEQQRQRFAAHWTLVVHDPEPRRLPPPNPLPTQSPGAAAWLARDGQVWVAGGEQGLYHYDGRRWRHHGREQGLGKVSDLMQDGRGDLWVAGHVPYDPEPGRHPAAPLLRWREGRWQAYAREQGLNADSAMVLARDGEAVLVASNGGVSRVDAEGIRTRSGSDLGGAGFIVALSADEPGRWWLGHGVYRAGLSISLDGAVGRLSTRQGLFDDRIRALAHDDQGRVWLVDEDGRTAVYPRALLLQRAGLMPEASPELER